jgi:hypothetical protein
LWVLLICASRGVRDIAGVLSLKLKRARYATDRPTSLIFDFDSFEADGLYYGGSSYYYRIKHYLALCKKITLAFETNDEYQATSHQNALRYSVINNNTEGYF